MIVDEGRSPSVADDELLQVGRGGGGTRERGEPQGLREEAEGALVLVELRGDIGSLHIGTGDDPGDAASTMRKVARGLIEDDHEQSPVGSEVLNK